MEKAKDLKEKGMPELEKILEEKREKVRKLRFDIATKQVKNTRELRNERKDIARILTIIAEKNGKDQEK